MTLDHPGRASPDDVQDRADGDKREAANADGIRDQICVTETKQRRAVLQVQNFANVQELLDIESHAPCESNHGRHNKIHEDDLVDNDETDSNACHQALCLQPETNGCKDKGHPGCNCADGVDCGVLSRPDAGGDVECDIGVSRGDIHAQSETRDDVHHEMQ